MKLPFRSRKADDHAVAQHLQAEVPQNSYYERISERLGILQVILYLSLLAFVVLSFFANTNLITYQNFYHFFKDLNASAETVNVLDTDSVSYPMDEEQSFVLYRKGLAIAGNNNVTVFTAAGRQTVSKAISYQNPLAVGSGKYLLVYELGGKQYSIYNSYTQVFSGESEYPINGAAVSDSGMYALISSSAEFTSVVSLYNDRFALINRYNKNGYVMDVAINGAGSLIGILTSMSEDGLFSTNLMICEPGKSTARADVTVSRSLGWSCDFTDDGIFAVICGNEISFVGSDGKLKYAHAFDGYKLFCADCDQSGSVLYLQSPETDGKGLIWAFDKSGKSIYRQSTEHKVKQIAKSGNAVYLLATSGVERLLLKSGDRQFMEINTDQRTLLVVNEREFLLCSSKKAQYLQMKS